MMRRLSVAVLSFFSGCGVVSDSAGEFPAEHSTFAWADREIRLETVRARGESPSKSTVFLLHGVGGMPGDGKFIRTMARALAAAGHDAVVVRYFDVTGHWIATRGIAMRRGAEWRDALTGIIRDYADKNPDRKIGILGYSLGGFLSVALAATASPLDAVVIYSGGILEQHEALPLGAMPPTLIVHGDADSIVDPALSAKLHDLASRAGVDVTRIVYPGEGHVFRKAAQAEATAQIVKFFSQHLQTGQPLASTIISRPLTD